MCRNHRGFVEAAFAVTRCGADLLFLNTEFGDRQLGEVLARERPDVVIADEEFLPALAVAAPELNPIVAWHDGPASPDPISAPHGARVTLDALRRTQVAATPRTAPGRLTLLTAGTTGTPKGAPRRVSSTALLGPFATGLTRLRLRAGEPILCGPPLFHGFGLATLALALFLGSPLILRRRFDAESTATVIAEHRVGFLSAVPVMIQRLLDLPPEVLGRYDLSSLRIVLSAGSALSPALAARAREQWGEVLHNGYGSSEVGVASLSTPDDLREAPGTVGRPSLGTEVRILDERDRPVPRGEVGRIFVGGGMQFSGYTGGGGKQVVDGLMSSGDRGHFDAEGRLFVDGREDDMIVSGGENVYPQEVEDCLAARPELREVAVLGVDDEAFGQRLVAFAVRRPGATVGEDELREHVRTSLARYKAPRSVLFLDELPRNGVGKVSRTALLAVVREDAAR